MSGMNWERWARGSRIGFVVLPIIGIAFLLFLWFAGAVANALRTGGEGRLAGTTVATAAALAGLQFGVAGGRADSRADGDACGLDA